ncbi:slr1659 superfamily regulator [Dapis sp. BLCC M126]|uniref:slr1659 superfamily regulator n=1 Tax=Dapis sp. BLCC M126 TaxID=3400189 RepID=UPI003CF76FB3
MEVKDQNYQVNFDSDTATVTFQGSLRLSGMEEYKPIVELLNQVNEMDYETINLDLKELEFLNSSGISVLSKFVISVRKKKSTSILIKGSKGVPWQGKSLKNLQRLMPTLILELEELE